MSFIEQMGGELEFDCSRCLNSNGRMNKAVVIWHIQKNNTKHLMIMCKFCYKGNGYASAKNPIAKKIANADTLNLEYYEYLREECSKDIDRQKKKRERAEKPRTVVRKPHLGYTHKKYFVPMF